MSQTTSDSELCPLPPNFVADGMDLESEVVGTSESPASALPKELKLISETKKQLEVGLTLPR
jgi:hypothetical protein